MISRTRTAFKFFVYGLLIGIFFAPRSGAETRAKVMAWVGQAAKDAMNGVLGGQSSA